MVQMQIPPQVERIIGKLNQNGYEAYAVGGCVRDTLLGKEPEDWDITTSALPWQVKSLFPRTIDTGIQHGTVTILMDHTGYEVTTYRIDGEYEDGRHPKEVAFTPDLREDLRRRDFTINAMAYSHETGIVDEFGGMEDLKQGIIRCVGTAMDRFQEDALRILRAIRFSAQLNFQIEKETWEAIFCIAPNLVKVSKERIQIELTKLLLSPHPEQITDVYRTGISRYVSDSFAAIPYEDIIVTSELPEIRYIRWAACLRGISSSDAVRVLKDLKMDNDTISKVQTLVSWAGKELSADPVELRKGMSRMEPEVWDALLILNGCGQDVRTQTEQIRKAGDCLSLKELAVSGQDLIDAGIRPGKELGKILSDMLEAVLEHPDWNCKEVLMSKVFSG